MTNSTNSGLRERPKSTMRIIAGIGAAALAIAIFVVSSIPSDGFPSHPSIINVIAHFLEYLVLAVLLSIALNSPKRALWITAIIALTIASIYAVTDEVHQYFIPGRHSDPLDWLTDTLGALVGAIGTIWIISARKVKQSRTRDSKK